MLDLPDLDDRIEKNAHCIHDNAIGWKISTIIAVIALVYSIMYNNHQDSITKDTYITLEDAQCMLYKHLTGMADPVHDCNRTKVVTP